MRTTLFFAIAVIAITAMAKLYVENGAKAVVTAPAVPEPQSSGYRTLTLSRGSNGHFETAAMIEGRRIEFLVDTGASVIALREQDAGRLGFHPTRRDYTAKVSTANGTVLAALVELNRVEVGELVVFNVAALVLPDEALAQNLLGMSFLSRVRWEHRDGKLVLEQ